MFCICFVDKWKITVLDINIADQSVVVINSLLKNRLYKIYNNFPSIVSFLEWKTLARGFDSAIMYTIHDTMKIIKNDPLRYLATYHSWTPGFHILILHFKGPFIFATHCNYIAQPLYLPWSLQKEIMKCLLSMWFFRDVRC